MGLPAPKKVRNRSLAGLGYHLVNQSFLWFVAALLLSFMRRTDDPAVVGVSVAMAISIASGSALLGAAVVVRIRLNAHQRQQWLASALARQLAVASLVAFLLIAVALPVFAIGPASLAFDILSRLILLQIVLYGGMFALANAFVFRKGTELRCAACGYERSSETAERRESERCSECGFEWMQRRGLVIGRRATHWPLWWLGAGMLFTGVGIFALDARGLQTMSGSVLIRLLPTNRVVEVAFGDDALDSEFAWSELFRRSLSDHELNAIGAQLAEVSGGRSSQFYRFLELFGDRATLDMETWIELIERDHRWLYSSLLWARLEPDQLSDDVATHLVGELLERRSDCFQIPLEAAPFIQGCVDAGDLDSLQLENLRAEAGRLKIWLPADRVSQP